ncbi:hypothetical protein ACWDCZ_40820, partial [Kitasatospora sp. NPDC001225]
MIGTGNTPPTGRPLFDPLPPTLINTGGRPRAPDRRSPPPGPADPAPARQGQQRPARRVIHPALDAFAAERVGERYVWDAT